MLKTDSFLNVREERASHDPATGVITAKLNVINSTDVAGVLVREVFVDHQVTVDQGVGFASVGAKCAKSGFAVTVPDTEPFGLSVRSTDEREAPLVASVARPFRMGSTGPGEAKGSTNAFTRPGLPYTGRVKVRFAFVIPPNTDVSVIFVADLKKG